MGAVDRTAKGKRWIDTPIPNHANQDTDRTKQMPREPGMRRIDRVEPQAASANRKERDGSNQQ